MLFRLSSYLYLDLKQAKLVYFFLLKSKIFKCFYASCARSKRTWVPNRIYFYMAGGYEPIQLNFSPKYK